MNFDLEIKDKKGSENLVADHLSHLEKEKESAPKPIGDSFLDEFLLALHHIATPWYVDIANYLVGGCYWRDYHTNKGRGYYMR